MGGLFSGILGGKEPATPVATPPPPVMPTNAGANQKDAARLSATEQMRRRGRANAILTADDDTLGV